MSDLEAHDVPETVDPDGWHLTVDGCVDTPLTLSLESLQSMELVAATGDFSCVDGWTATDLEWKGVRVTDLVTRAQPRPEAAFALVHAMDGEYACSYPLGQLEGALLALELDGRQLPLEHGGPARLVPANDASECWESVKWVNHIELHATEPQDTARDLALSRL